jgi:hypothetical protein
MHADQHQSFFLALSAEWKPIGSSGLALRRVFVGPQTQTFGARTYTRTEQCVAAGASASAGELAKGLLLHYKHDTLS